MATFDIPQGLRPESMEWGTAKRAIQSSGMFAASTQSIEFPGERWLLSLSYPPRMDMHAGEAEAFWSRLAGGVDKVRVWHYKRPLPVGSMRGSPSLAATASRGQQVVQIATTGDLKAGDLFRVGNQLMQCFQDCEPVAGVLTVPLVHRVRATISAGSPVEYERPFAIFHVPAITN